VSKKSRLALVPRPPALEEELEPICEDAPYPRYKPGTYEGRCVSAKRYRDPRFKRLILKLEFRILPDCRPIVGFLNLGNGDKPKAGRGSEYRRAWTIANGDAPRKSETMTKRVFEGKVFSVRVGDTTKKHDGREHLPGEVYSTVKEILKRLWP
jgi:hypothetical protein